VINPRELRTTTPVPILGPYMDAGRHASKLQAGTFSRVFGVDGRHLGSIRPFPGFTRLGLAAGWDVRSVTGCSGITNVNWSQYIQLQQGVSGDPTTGLLSGFLMRVTDGGVVKLVFVYYTGSAWAAHFVNSGTAVSATARIDVTTFGLYMYVAVEGNAVYPRTLWYDDAAWVDTVMGPVWTTLTGPTVAKSSGAGVLEEGTYGVAYRFSHSVRNVYSGMSGITMFDLDTDDKYLDVTIPHPGAAVDVNASFDTIEVFRTINVDVAGATYSGGILYKCNTVALSTTWTSGNKASTGGETTRDVLLVQLDAYDPWEDQSGLPPSSGSIKYVGGTVFMGQAPDAQGGGAGLRWSSMTSLQPEQFNPDHIYRGRLADGTIERIVEGGDVIYGLSGSTIYRIRKTGTQLMFNRMHEGRGITSRMSAHGVGGDLLLLTPLGIAVVNGINGDMSLHSEVDRIIYDDWKGSLDTVQACYDSYMGCSFFVNTTRREAIVLWHVSKLATLLKDVDFVAATTGSHPVDGGGQRAFFTTATGCVVYPNSDGSGTITMLGVTGTINGTTTSLSSSRVIDTAASFVATAVGAKVRLLSGDHKDEEFIVTSWVSGTALAVTLGGKVIASGTQYSISPIPFELKFPPLTSPRVVIPETVRVVLRGVELYATGYTGISGNVNANWRVGAYREGSTTIDTTYNTEAMAEGELTILPSSTAPGSIDGFQLEPFIGAYVAGVAWELIGVEFLHSPIKSRGGLG